VTFSLAEWERRRAADSLLDARLGRLGYGPRNSGYHVAGCGVGLTPGARCICREATAAREGRRRRSRRVQLLTR
jgi:hypothetical protein